MKMTKVIPTISQQEQEQEHIDQFFEHWDAMTTEEREDIMPRLISAMSPDLKDFFRSLLSSEAIDAPIH